MSLVLSFKFSPVTAVEVERTFSTLKWVLSYKCSNQTTENLEKLMILHSYHQKQGSSVNVTKVLFSD